MSTMTIKPNIMLILFIGSKSWFLRWNKFGDFSQGWPEVPFSIATPFPGLLLFTLDPYIIMLSVKQSGIKYHFLSLWYDSTRNWNPVSRTIGKHYSLGRNTNEHLIPMFE